MLSYFIEIALRHGCSPVNLLRILRTPFLKNTSGRLLLFIIFDKVKFSTHMINSTRDKIEFSCFKCFMSIILLVFALAAAPSKFRFAHLETKWSISFWWLRITSILGCNLTSIKNAFSKVLQKSCLIMVRATTWHNFLSSDQLLLGNVWVQ